MKKKVLSLLLTLCLVMTFVPMAAFAAEAPLFSGGTGTQQDPWLITSQADLIALAEFLNSGLEHRRPPSGTSRDCRSILRRNAGVLSAVAGQSRFNWVRPGLWQVQYYTLRQTDYGFNVHSSSEHCRGFQDYVCHCKNPVYA